MAETVLNTLAFSDEFRKRTARRSGSEGFVVDLSRQFAVISTHWEHALPDHIGFNRKILDYMTCIGEALTHHAKERGYTGIVLPREGVSDFGKYLHEKLCVPLSERYGIAVTLQTEQFFPNYADIDAAVKTCLDEGIRGVVHAASPIAPEYSHV